MVRISKKIKIVLAAGVICAAFIAGNIWYSYNHLTVNNYAFSSEKVHEDLRIVVLADLHDHRFGDLNEKLVNKVLEQQPDLVLLVGDFLNRDSENSSVPLDLIRTFDGRVPLYFALGNHEIDYMNVGHPELIEEIEALGVPVLEEEYVDLDIKGTPIRLGGMYAYAFSKDGENIVPEPEKSFLEDFVATDRLKLMMAHRPDSFVFGDASKLWDIDLVMSGHDHGGQVVVPFFGGLYGGDQGYFPEYIHGMYEKDNIHIFVTSGLSSHFQLLPRFNNPPEVTVLDFVLR